MTSEGTIIRRNPFVLVMKMIVSIFIFSLLYSLFIFGTDYDQVVSQNVSFFQEFEVGLVGMIAITLIEILYALWLILQWTHETFRIRYDEIVHRSGVIAIHERRYSLKNIENIFLQQSLMGRIFGFGTIQLQGRFLKVPVFLRGIIDPAQSAEAIKTMTIMAEHKPSTVALHQ